MANTANIFIDMEQQKTALQRLKRFDDGDGGGYDEDMEARVAKLEDFVVDARDRLTKIETRLDQTATKADLQESSNGMIKWIVGTAAGLGVAAITVMTFVLNNATPKAQSSAQPPIIITVPQPAQPPQSPAQTK